jgi:hypothetical protein
MYSGKIAVPPGGGGIVILDLENTLVVEIRKGILLYSCHIVRKFLNIDTEHKTQKSQNVEARHR